MEHMLLLCGFCSEFQEAEGLWDSDQRTKGIKTPFCIFNPPRRSLIVPLSGMSGMVCFCPDRVKLWLERLSLLFLCRAVLGLGLLPFRAKVRM